MKWALTHPEKFNDLSLAYSDKADFDLPYTGPLVTVGDYTSEKFNSRAMIKIYDGVTRRDQEGFEPFGNPKTEFLVENPAGSVSHSAFETVEYILGKYRSVNIKVSGEEDLLVIPVVLFAPDHYIVAWGDPFENCTRYITVSPATRRAVLSMLAVCGEWSK